MAGAGNRPFCAGAIRQKGRKNEIFTGIRNDEARNPGKAPVMGRILELGSGKGNNYDALQNQGF